MKLSFYCNHGKKKYLLKCDGKEGRKMYRFKCPECGNVILFNVNFYNHRSHIPTLKIHPICNNHESFVALYPTAYKFEKGKLLINYICPDKEVGCKTSVTIVIEFDEIVKVNSLAELYDLKSQ